MIRIVDYGLGNVQAFLTMFKRLGVSAERAQRPEEIGGATKLILPGVGAFDHAMQLLNDSGLRNELERLALHEKIPVLGICVGMQMLGAGSDEGSLPGLNWVPGRVRAFSKNQYFNSLPLPHMGWNDLELRRDSPLFRNSFESESRFYFLHSYYFDAFNIENVAATANYGIDFAAVVSKDNIHGVQCHPEKSHHWGAQLLKNFADM